MKNDDDVLIGQISIDDFVKDDLSIHYEEVRMKLTNYFDAKCTVTKNNKITINCVDIMCWLMSLYISALKGKAKKLGINHKGQITKVIRKIKNNIKSSIMKKLKFRINDNFLPYKKIKTSKSL